MHQLNFSFCQLFQDLNGGNPRVIKFPLSICCVCLLSLQHKLLSIPASLLYRNLDKMQHGVLICNFNFFLAVVFHSYSYHSSSGIIHYLVIDWTFSQIHFTVETTCQCYSVDCLISNTVYSN